VILKEKKEYCNRILAFYFLFSDFDEILHPKDIPIGFI
jgi:hypothetical protein